MIKTLTDEINLMNIKLDLTNWSFGGEFIDSIDPIGDIFSLGPIKFYSWYYDEIPFLLIRSRNVD